MVSENIRGHGTLRAGVANAKEGDALYWDAAGDLGICGVDDYYRYAGQLLPTDTPSTNTTGLYATGAEVAVDRFGIRKAYGDGIATYLRGMPLTTGAAGVLVPAEGVRRVLHTVTGGEAAAGLITLTDNVDHVVTVRNNNLVIDFLMADEGSAPGPGVCAQGSALPRTLSFNLADITAADIIAITFEPHGEKVAEVAIVPDGDELMYIKQGGN